MTSDAISILQAWLDDLSDALLHGGSELIADRTSLPYLHQSEDARFVIETRKDLIEGYEASGKTMRDLGANQLIRLASAAEYLSDDYIEGTYVSHVLRNATPVVPSYVSRIVLRRGSNSWLLAEGQVALGHGSWPPRVFHIKPKNVGPAAGSSQDVRREAAQPLALYQRFLNALTRCNVTGDFDGYCGLCDFPYTVHSSIVDGVFEAPSDVRPFFDSLTDLFQKNDIEDYLRIADHAEFISGTEICGYHTTRFQKGGTDALAPIKSRMILRRIDTRWYLKSVTNALLNTDILFREPISDADLVTHLEIHERTKT